MENRKEYNFDNFTVNINEKVKNKLLYDVIDFLFNLLEIKINNISVYDINNKKYLNTEMKSIYNPNIFVESLGYKIANGEFKILILVYHDESTKGN